MRLVIFWLEALDQCSMPAASRRPRARAAWRSRGREGDRRGGTVEGVLREHRLNEVGDEGSHLGTGQCQLTGLPRPVA